MTDELSPIEAIMWRIGQTGSLRMTVGAVMIVDRLPDHASLLERLRFAGEHAERLTQRPGAATSLRSRPSWISAPFSPDHQLRSLAVSAPGTMREVLDLVGLLESVPFDPERSPWDVTLIDGLEDGKAAIYLRAHHVLTDGVGGIRLIGLLLDESAWPKDPLTPPPPQPAPKPHALPDQAEPRRLGTITFTATLDGPEIVGRALAGINSAREVDALESAVNGVQWAIGVANSVSRQLMVTGGPLSSRPTTRSMLSRFEVVSVDGARAAALALGGSRNDLLVAAAAAGIGLYHERLGEPCAELRLATPASTRGSDDAGGNWFAPTRLSVPTAIGRPGPQFGVVAERLDQARKEPALRVASALATSFRLLPTRFLTSALNAQAESVDFAATAIPGLRGQRHVCGSLIEAVYPLGPRLGCPLNITALGNEDRLDIGIALDSSVIRKPDVLVSSLTEAFSGFGAAGPSRETG
jgi:diacylglycerol O-acyltransferase / wax synthase